MDYGDDQTDFKTCKTSILRQLYWAHMTAHTKLPNAKTITHHFQKQHLWPLNHCSGFSGFGSPAPVEAAAAETANLVVESYSAQKAGSRENSSCPAKKKKGATYITAY